MGTRGDTYPLVFLLLILFPSPPPGSTQTSTDVKCLGPSRADCRPHVRCINLAGSYYCNCIDGYESSSGQAMFSGASDNTCHDIDECLGPSRADCGPHTHCTNTPGSYSCSCMDGYESSSGKATFRGASENTCRELGAGLTPVSSTWTGDKPYGANSFHPVQHEPVESLLLIGSQAVRESSFKEGLATSVGNDNPWGCDS
ncbi:adhesion G protein-coupled receptor E5-like [Emydura macquarii macquarii]|uniref:adhesion G protein-coupled receptor E5-like n=1 Tax=Emydura macquarii macquarii TaxID=1129001 RepID=UPI003529E39A